MIWDIKTNQLPSQDCGLFCDVLVIGGGAAGILCAKMLDTAGLKTVLVEGKRVGMGITRHTTAVITAQHDTLYSQMVKDVGFDRAKAYLDANLWAVEEYRRLAQDIPCDFEERPSYIYSTGDRQLMQDEVQTLHQLGFDAEFTDQTELPIEVEGAVKFPDMAQFHPLKFVTSIAKDLTIYENTFVRAIDGNRAVTNHGTIQAKHIIVATHYPFINRTGLFPAKLYQKRSYVIAVRGAQGLHGTYVQDGEGGLYFRDCGDLLLIGGSDHRTGTKGTAFEPMRAFARQHYPKAEEVYAFTNQDCVSLDGISYIGPYGHLLPDAYVATGFNLWGMTNAMVSSRILTELITGQESQFAWAFDPARPMLLMPLLANIGVTAANLLWPTAKRCSHLGCALHYNKLEHSWDCACHGSRFSEEGKCLNNPAMKDGHV